MAAGTCSALEWQVSPCLTTTDDAIFRSPLVCCNLLGGRAANLRLWVARREYRETDEQYWMDRFFFDGPQARA